MQPLYKLSCTNYILKNPKAVLLEMKINNDAICTVELTMLQKILEGERQADCILVDFISHIK